MEPLGFPSRAHPFDAVVAEERMFAAPVRVGGVEDGAGKEADGRRP